MTEEEKETISILKDLAEHGLCYTVTEDIQGKLKIILNLIQRKDRQIQKLENKNKDLLRKLRNRVKEVRKLIKYSTYKKEFSRLNAIIEQKDRQIDLMAFSLADYVMYYEYDKCRNPEIIKAKAEEQKQYFAEQAKEVEE